MIRYYLSKYLAPIHSFKKFKNGYYYAMPVGGHSTNTINIYYSIPNLIHIEGHIQTILYNNHFHRSIFIPNHATQKDVQIRIEDGFIRLYVPLNVQNDKHNKIQMLNP